MEVPISALSLSSSTRHCFAKLYYPPLQRASLSNSKLYIAIRYTYSFHPLCYHGSRLYTLLHTYRNDSSQPSLNSRSFSQRFIWQTSFPRCPFPRQQLPSRYFPFSIQLFARRHFPAVFSQLFSLPTFSQTAIDKKNHRFRPSPTSAYRFRLTNELFTFIMILILTGEWDNRRQDRLMFGREDSMLLRRKWGTSDWSLSRRTESPTLSIVNLLVVEANTLYNCLRGYEHRSHLT